MNKAGKERHEWRGNPRPSGLTQLAEVQVTEALRSIRTSQRFFAHLRRCSPWNMPAYPAGLRLAGRQIFTAYYVKINGSRPSQ